MAQPVPEQWNPPPASVHLSENEVHVWLADLNVPPSTLAELQQCLLVDEQERAGRLRQTKHREHWVAARGLRRLILSRYLCLAPKFIRFTLNPHGKPALSPESHASPLRFNQSDSHGRALFAVSLAREVGVDLEKIRPSVAREEIAERFFSRGEAQALRALAPAQQVQAFFNCWTRKEAFIKALGQGLFLPLNQFEVSLAPGEPAELLRVANDPAALTRWSLRELPPVDGYSAALVVEGTGWELKCWKEN